MKADAAVESRAWLPTGDAATLSGGPKGAAGPHGAYGHEIMRAGRRGIEPWRIP